jgi:hypothetical protein
MRSRFSFFVISAMGIVALFALSASAHHGFGGNTKELVLTGTVVTSVSLAGPHATMRVRDEKGQVWDVTLAPAPRTSATGLKEDLIPVGAQVKLEGLRNDDPKRFEIKTRRVIWNGRNFDVYPTSQR